MPWSGHFGEEKNLLHPQGFKPWTVQLQRVATPTMLFQLPHIPGHHILLRIMVRKPIHTQKSEHLTFAGHKRGLNKHKIILRHELQTTTLCCPCSPTYFGNKFFRPGSNFVTHSAVNTTHLETKLEKAEIIQHVFKMLYIYLLPSYIK